MLWSRSTRSRHRRRAVAELARRHELVHAAAVALEDVGEGLLLEARGHYRGLEWSI